MNTNPETSAELQIQICNYLANMINQIDTKINLLSNSINIIDNRLVIIEDKINSLQNNQNLEPPKKIKKTSIHQHVMNVDNNNNNNNNNNDNDNNREDLEINYSGMIKQKIAIARNEYELELLLNNEKEKWKKEFQLKQEIIDQHKIEWENQQKEIIEKETQHTFLYLN